MNEVRWVNWHEWNERNELPKVLPPLRLFTVFTWNPAIATVSCTFCWPHLPKVVWDHQFFLMICLWNEALATVLCASCQPHLPKMVWVHQFFEFFFLWNRALATILCASCRPHLPKMVWDHQFFEFFFLWNRALAIVLCTFCWPHLPKVVWDRQCLPVFMWNRASLQSRAHFVDLIFQKWSETVSFFTIFRWNRALATVLCTFCRPLFPARGVQLQKHRPPAATMDGVSRPRVFSSLNSRVPDRSHFSSTWCSCG